MSQGTIEDFICNLFAGKRRILDLYDAYFKAIHFRSESRKFVFKFEWPDCGCKIYARNCLIKLECEGRATSYSELCQEKSIDNVVRLLFKAMIPLRDLFCNAKKALYMRATIRVFCTVFNNPFRDCTDLNTNTKTLTGPQLIEFCCKCQNKTFQDFIIWGDIGFAPLDEAGLCD